MIAASIHVFLTFVEMDISGLELNNVMITIPTIMMLA
jgi:hypothetical protein